MALELGQYGIRVNSLNPTVTMTPLGKRVWSENKIAKTMLDRLFFMN